MNFPVRRRQLWLFWGLGFSLWIANALYPVGTRMTRLLGLVLLALVWFGLLALSWNRKGLRIALLAVTACAGGFLVFPERTLPSPDALRVDYLAGLRRYEGIRYYWGGETPKGIDCSGLVRRGLIDALFWRGMATCHPGLVRSALNLWWHDCTANDLGKGLTRRVLDTASINKLDHSKILPGDLAIVGNGSHVMAYLGENHWIEADPAIGRVITVTAPAEKSVWFLDTARIVRWDLLAR